MKDNPEYKTVSITFTSWQALTRISAQTGEHRRKALDRIIQEAEQRMRQEKDKENNHNEVD